MSGIQRTGIIVIMFGLFGLLVGYLFLFGEHSGEYLPIDMILSGGGKMYHPKCSYYLNTEYNRKMILIVGAVFAVFGAIVGVLLSFGTAKNKKCPSCHENIKLEARKCKHCGEEFDKN